MPSKYPKQVSEAKKIASRNKEKKRNVDINHAFNVLQSSFTSIPFITRKKKVPKVKMLRLAIKYIQHLEKVLKDEIHRPSPYCPPRPITLEDFEIVAAEEFNERNSYSNRLHEDEEYYTVMASRSSTSSSLPFSFNHQSSPSPSSSRNGPSPTPFNSPPHYSHIPPSPVNYQYNH